MTARMLDLDPARPYREIKDPPLTSDLRDRAVACFAAQRQAREARQVAVEGAPALAAEAVSAARLASLLESGQVVAGIASEREIATAVPFNVHNVARVARDDRVAALRRRLDLALGRWAREQFRSELRPILFPAGHWWYPPGTYLGWHTNEHFPGWRLYLSHAEEPGRSFFRYRDPQSGEIVTSPDAGWDLRLFEVTAERRFWHAVLSETHRFSIGWIVRPWSVPFAAKAAAKRVVGAIFPRAAL